MSTSTDQARDLRASQKPPTVMAHRGDLSNAQENTLEAISDALTAGVRYIECDIQLNADKTPVLLHDGNLQRTHHINQRVFEGVHPLDTLAQLLVLLDQWPQAVAFLEVKSESINHWGTEVMAAQLVPMLAGKRQRHALISSHWGFLESVRHYKYPNIGAILPNLGKDTEARMRALQPEQLIINHHFIGQGTLWNGPWQWSVYEIGSVSQALHWASRGADFIISFKCAALHHQLNSRHSNNHQPNSRQPNSHQPNSRQPNNKA